MGTILELKQIQKYYGNEGNITKAINNISFTVEEGEFLGIMGASGSGKTTLLNCISTIDTVSAGHIYLYGQQAEEDVRLIGKDKASYKKAPCGIDITQMKQGELARFRRENLGFVFQDFNLLDTLTISENIALALSINKVPASEVEGRVEEMCEQLNIGDILHKYPYQVSGGQKQRCACARALINHPKLFLADEPTGALDSVSAGQLLALLTELNEKEDATILMVTHDPLSASYGSRVLFLKDGRINKELHRGRQGRSDFYHAILSEVSAFGGM